MLEMRDMCHCAIPTMILGVSLARPETHSRATSVACCLCQELRTCFVSYQFARELVSMTRFGCVLIAILSTIILLKQDHVCPNSRNSMHLSFPIRHTPRVNGADASGTAYTGSRFQFTRLADVTCPTYGVDSAAVAGSFTNMWSSLVRYCSKRAGSGAP